MPCSKIVPTGTHSCLLQLDKKDSRSPLEGERELVAQMTAPVPAQAKACSYIDSCYVGLFNAKFLPDTVALTRL